MMRVCLAALLLPAFVIAGCGGNSAISPGTTAASTTVPTPVCPPADGVGSVPPAVSIYSVTLLVDGSTQIIRDGQTPEAAPGNEVRIMEVEICANDTVGARGEVCVDIAPLDGNGEEIRAQAGGTHMQPVPAGFTTVPGPPTVWTIGEDWQGFIVVLNHWATGATDPACAAGRCERDDELTILLS